MSAIGYYIFIFIVWVVNLLPMRLVYFKSDFLFLVLYHLTGYRKQVVITNLRNSFPEKPDQEIKIIMKRFYRHFCDLFVETIALYGMSETEILKRVKYKNPEVLDDLYSRNKSISIIIGHYGNWEWLSSVSLITKYKVLAIYKPLSNSYFDKFMIKLREKNGMYAVPMAKIAREVVKAKIENQPVAIYFAADQSPLRSEIRNWVTFLNQETAIFSGPEKIAKKNDHAVVFFKMSKVKRGYYEVEFIKLFDDLKNIENNEITLKHNKVLEDIINETPEYWLWTHRRWKHKRDE